MRNLHSVKYCNTPSLTTTALAMAKFHVNAVKDKNTKTIKTHQHKHADILRRTELCLFG